MELIAHMRIKKGSLLSESNKRFAVCTGGDGGKNAQKMDKKVWCYLFGSRSQQKHIWQDLSKRKHWKKIWQTSREKKAQDFETHVTLFIENLTTQFKPKW